mmetsp:Transcript_6575/g.16199  ORF Transcript_6575/g.16199 Transcript_6575/m.16199 type:complete len:90 (-) Transcript_6575:146-415(-)
MIPRRLHKETISSISGSFCGSGASFSSAAEAATSSVAADDNARLAREATAGRPPVKAKALAKFCPQRNIITEAVENFIGGSSFFQNYLK